ncbi:MAG: DNA topoisomerase, partial [Patescibacteria group bacterium]
SMRQLKLYSLIWRRAVASQMTDAVLSTMAVNILAETGKAPAYTFRATGSTIKEKGFMEVYETETKETLLPPLTENESVDLDALTPKQHFTEPPPRYTEASLVKTLEENGIGRPSTYAPTISTVVDRGYVEKDERKLKPTEMALLVNDLLVAHFPDIVDYQFTAHMEESLDAVAEGEKDWVPVIRAFYEPFKKNLKVKEKEIDKKDITETATKEVCEKCGKPMIIKIGRFGRFMACSGYPECRNTKPIPGSEESKTDVSGEVCPTCGAPMMVKRGRFGEFMSCSRYPDCKTIKPILKKTGAKCTECKQGDIIEKKSRKGKIFYACSRYPDCKFALWAKPTGDNCPACGSLLVYAKGEMVRCSKEGCGFEKEAQKKE